MILGLAGDKDSGRDVVAAYLIKTHGFERRAFADPIKQSIAALFGISFHEVDKYKNDEDIKVVIEHRRAPTIHTAEFAFHEFIDRYAEQAHKGVFGENFWLDYTLPKDGFYSGRKIVVTDVRFENELLRIHNCGGYVARVIRPDAEIKDQHRLRVVDINIHNDGNVEQLYDNIEHVLVRLGERRAVGA